MSWQSLAIGILFRHGCHCLQLIDIFVILILHQNRQHRKALEAIVIKRVKAGSLSPAVS